MNMKIKDSIVWTAFLAVMAIIMFPSCSDEHEAVILEITNNEIILQAEGDPVQVEVKSNTEWRIDFVESTWFSTDIRGAQSSRTYFTVTYDENISDSERFCDIRVFTKDGKTADVIKIKQLSRYPFIVPASDKMELFTKGGEYEMEISTNVPETDTGYGPAGDNGPAVRHLCLLSGKDRKDTAAYQPVHPRYTGNDKDAGGF
jgi:hypothetical protein